MGKVFITKYNQEVNASLPKFGAMILDIVLPIDPQLDTNAKGVYKQNAVRILPSVASKKLEIISNHWFEDENGNNLGKTITVTGGKGQYHDIDGVFWIGGAKSGDFNNPIRLQILDFANDIQMIVFHKYNTVNREYGYSITCENPSIIDPTIKINDGYILPTTDKLEDTVPQLSNGRSWSKHVSTMNGDIASLANCTAITQLDLVNTKVSGDITNIVTNLTKLTNLSIPPTVTITDAQKKTLTDRGCTITIG